MSDDVVIWTALADSKRRQIINLLEEKPRTTNELSKFFDVSRFAVMKHLKVLEQANLIKVKREGRKRWNILDDDMVRFLRTKLADDDESLRLVDILGLIPGRTPGAPKVNGASEPVQTVHSVLIRAFPAQVFEALTVGINGWWRWRVSTDSQVRLEPVVNGRFYEAFNRAGEGVFYANVTYIKQDEEIRLRGPMALPEQEVNVPVPDSYVRIVLEPEDRGTNLSLSHHIAGDVDQITRDVCRRRWHVLLNQNLKPFVEKGIAIQEGP